MVVKLVEWVVGEWIPAASGCRAVGRRSESAKILDLIRSFTVCVCVCVCVCYRIHRTDVI